MLKIKFKNNQFEAWLNNWLIAYNKDLSALLGYLAAKSEAIELKLTND
jgi:hypothetical protein